ncbi:MAG: DinB family protein [Bacteroidia bacterium]|nr:DinB family protein [Bacteroidia bacterium]
MKTEIQTLCDILKHSFEKNAWHGPAVLEALSDIDEKIINKKINKTHSILELVTHMTAWRTYVINMLLGNDGFEISDEMNFQSEISWSHAIADLKESQVKLLIALESFPIENLHVLVPNRPYKFFTMLHGIIHHDLYHVGQIVLIKRIHE